MKKKAFTLIELLVVIAIIALLVSILMPSLNKAKALARKVVCQSNLKAISLGLGLYQNEYDGKLPPLYVGSAANSNWFTRLYPYTEYPSKGYFQNGNVYDTESASLFRCPDINSYCRAGWYTREDGVNDIHVTAYMINYHVHEDRGNNVLAGKNIADIPKPASTVYCLDSMGIAMPGLEGWVIDTSGIHFPIWSVEYTYYHLDSRANTLWVDGHVSDMTSDEFTEDKLDPEFFN